jgi:hypothetical protein
VIHILPPRPPEGRGFRKRLAHGFPDLALGAMFAAAWLDLFGFGGRYGVDLMLLVEIEGWILIVTILSVGAAYGFATETEWKDKAKSMAVLVLLCTVPPAYFALRWHLWWPLAAYGALLWNRVRLARAGREGARHLRAPLREMVLFGAAAAASVWFTVPALGASDIHFRIADYPGWCHAPQWLLPDDLIENQRVVTWCDEPHRALAAGSLYYAAIGLLTLWRGPYRLSLWWGWVRREPEE